MKAACGASRFFPSEHEGPHQIDADPVMEGAQRAVRLLQLFADGDLLGAVALAFPAADALRCKGGGPGQPHGLGEFKPSGGFALRGHQVPAPENPRDIHPPLGQGMQYLHPVQPTFSPSRMISLIPDRKARSSCENAPAAASVSNQRLQQLLDLHPTDIGKILSGLVDKKMLISEWKGRWTTYTINRDYQ